MDYLDQMLELAHDLKGLVPGAEPGDLRWAVELLREYPEDETICLDGEDWRFIGIHSIDEIMEEELSSDTYVLGCFNADFLAAVTDLPKAMIEACQKADAYAAIGEAILACGWLEDVQREYARADGYGHHFGHYDNEEHEISVAGSYYHVFRVG